MIDTAVLAAFIQRCDEIREGSPNAFYAHVDHFCKRFREPAMDLAVTAPQAQELERHEHLAIGFHAGGCYKGTEVDAYVSALTHALVALRGEMETYTSKQPIEPEQRLADLYHSEDGDNDRKGLCEQVAYLEHAIAKWAAILTAWERET